MNTPLSHPTATNGDYALSPDGIWRPSTPVEHRSDEYNEAGFEQLVKMQQRHFWYVGRHRFLLAAVRQQLARQGLQQPAAIDLGGGCGGWIKYLHDHAGAMFSELALSDSSLRGLSLAKGLIGSFAQLYQTDILRLQWRDRWDVVFLLDVLEHIPEDAAALREIRSAMRPGGLLFVTTPALKIFWSSNDDLVHHVRRYSRHDFAELARQTGLQLVTSRYFMFFLSPLLFLSRLKKRDVAHMTADDVRNLREKTHRVPGTPVNQILSAIFAMETPAGLWCPFPWGTSVLGVFRKPA